MAKRDYIELLFSNEKIECVKTTPNWVIEKDSQYYYKTVQEQNYACLNGKVQQNLEYMMEEKNYLKGVNPVCDIYYLENQMIAYRAKIVEGKDIGYLQSIWGPDLEKWHAFLLKLSTILNLGKEKNYIFPDLFTKGNILYNLEKNEILIIDNDGIQIKENFPGMLDFIASPVANKESVPLSCKFFNFKNHFFKPEYNAFSFYSFFFQFFFSISLPSLINDYKNAKEILKKCQIPLYKDFWEEIQNLFSLEEKVSLKEKTIAHLCQNYQIEENNTSRRLIPR